MCDSLRVCDHRVELRKHLRVMQKPASSCIACQVTLPLAHRRVTIRLTAEPPISPLALASPRRQTPRNGRLGPNKARKVPHPGPRCHGWGAASRAERVGTNTTGGGAALYQTIDLPNLSVATGDYYVICANVSTTGTTTSTRRKAVRVGPGWAHTLITRTRQRTVHSRSQLGTPPLPTRFGMPPIVLPTAFPRSRSIAIVVN